MRQKTLTLSTAILVIFGLAALVIVGTDNVARAQQSPAIAPAPVVPPERLKPVEGASVQRPKVETGAQATIGTGQAAPAQQSPIIAPVPAVPPRGLKPEENTPDQRPKEETSAEGTTRRGQAPVVQLQNDVGVIPGSMSCPAFSELITIFMDDEDHKNANSRSGWIGTIGSDHNTTFVFCRVDGAQFVRGGAPYAVLQLSGRRLRVKGFFDFLRWFVGAVMSSAFCRGA